MEWLKGHWQHLTVGGLGSAGGLMFIARDSIKAWWEQRREYKKAEFEERRHSSTFGDKLASELLSMTKDHLKNNEVLMKDLHLVLSEMRDVMKAQLSQSSEALVMARETRESQRWIERQYGRPQ